MKKGLILTVGLCLLSTMAFAIHQPNWERPIQTADDMKIDNARYDFDKLVRTDLLLTQRDDSMLPTGMVITLHYDSIEYPARLRRVKLNVTDVEDIGCGSRQLIASLPQLIGGEEERPMMGRRFSIVLEDHSDRICEDYVPFEWVASVREGYGWCGTMDATMTLHGNPEPVYTIKNN